MSSSIERGLDRLHAAVRANPLLQRFTVCTRILLAIGFIPPSLTKIQGERFTILPIEHPVGFFFEAMYRTGGYWNFIGWAQLIGGILLLNPRTATLGAIVFFPIILNIFVITVALHFTGTWLITGLMLLACTYLLCWDYDRLKPLFWGSPNAPAPPTPLSPRSRTMERAAYGMMALGGIGLTMVIRGYLAPLWAAAGLGLGVAGFLCLIAALAVELRARRTVNTPERFDGLGAAG
ncbi:MAG TPA: hypothetical protein VF613_06480 [Longimicrobium sp.]|jgi:uncharacterized membrane protein YphA (DoxX/SURF4 family)